jgi:diacylglycerol kinase (ATP)
MRAAAILGLGCSAKALKPFQADQNVEWRLGMPAPWDAVDVILLFGGDGTLHRHLGQLVRLGLPVLVVPAGSGNDFARALGIRQVRDSVAAWGKFCSAASNIRAIDLGIISAIAEGRSASHGPHYFCCVAGLGLDSEVARRANQLPRWLRGHGGYALTLIPTIFRFAPVPVKIQIPDGSAGWTIRSDKPTILAAFANAPAYGGGMKIAPQAKMDDGLLDICIVGGVGPFKLLRLFPTVYAGKHLKIREVEYLRTERARIETEHPFDVYADGEYVCQTPIEVRLQCGALKVVTSCS